MSEKLWQRRTTIKKEKEINVRYVHLGIGLLQTFNDEKLHIKVIQLFTIICKVSGVLCIYT